MTPSVCPWRKTRSILMRSFRVAPRKAFHSSRSFPASNGVAEYKLLLKASATKEIEAVASKGDRRRIVEKIAGLGGDPRPRGSEKLAGYEDRYRLRQGNYRIVYVVDDSRRELTIFKIGHRKDVYR
jgi:mRNA interferase RelE/StbE